MWFLLWWHICCCLFRFVDTAFRRQGSWMFFFCICFAVSKLVTFQLIFPLLWCHHPLAWGPGQFQPDAVAVYLQPPTLPPSLSLPFHTSGLSHQGCLVLYSILFSLSCKKDQFFKCVHAAAPERFQRPTCHAARQSVEWCWTRWFRWKKGIIIQSALYSSIHPWWDCICWNVNWANSGWRPLNSLAESVLLDN